jgi:probable phosphoglycerate mutase
VQLILVRHGLPVREENPEGEPADPPLSAEGREQAERVARWLGHERIDALYTSPMRRARETAAPLEAKLGVPAAVEAGVMELDHLSTSYEPLEQLKVRDPQEWRRMVDGGLYENVDLDVFRQNVVETLTAIVERHSSESVAVFCHGGVINAWSGAVLGISEPFFFFEPGYTALHRFLVARTGERNLVSLNETGHLRAGTRGR